MYIVYYKAQSYTSVWVATEAVINTDIKSYAYAFSTEEYRTSAEMKTAYK